MKSFTRRDTVKLGAAALAGTALAGRVQPAGAQVQVKDVAPPKYEVEDGAKLHILRPSKFVSADEVFFRKNTEAFTEQYGVPVTIEAVSWEDLRPKTAVAARVGTGPDVVLAWSDDPFQFPERTTDLTDLATYLGEKYGGWWPVCEKYGLQDGKWVAFPIGGSGARVVCRNSWIGEVGYDDVPGDTDGFLELCRKLKEAGHPPGLATGHAVGDANAWTHWLVWSFGGAMVDENNNVIINSKETIEALKYGKELYNTFIPGTLAWNDANNNKAFLSGQLGLTMNGISVYFAAKNSDDPALQRVAEDIRHAVLPVGPVGRPTQRALIVNCMVFNFTPYPNAAKEYLRFMMEKEQYLPWLRACLGYWNHPLKAYDDAAFWTENPKVTPYQHVLKEALWDGYKGTMGPASSAVLANYVMVDMVASVCSGQATPEEAAAQAARSAERYYKS